MSEHHLTIRQNEWEQMRAHIAEQAPLEACGLLAGKNNRVEQSISIRNEAQSPVRFRMDAREQLQAFEQIEAAGFDILAIYHSHPTGPATPSPTDLAEAMYDVVYIIWAPQNDEWNARAFCLDAGHAAEVPLTILDV